MGAHESAESEPFSYASDPWIPAKSKDDIRIRLIELQPLGQQPPDAPLQCRLFWTPLSNHVPFKALSYSWGIDPPSSTCYVEGRFLSITPSLEAALQHIRHQSEPLFIWADQICINQSDDNEKSEGVGNMGRIYPAAAEVIVWLGPGTKDSDAFMDAFNEIGRFVNDADLEKYLYVEDQMAVIGRILGNVDPTDPETIKFHRLVDTVVPLLDEQLLRGLVTWNERAWFSRVWAVQEYALATSSTFMCGSKTVSTATAQLTRFVLQEALERVVSGLKVYLPMIRDSPMDVFLNLAMFKRRSQTARTSGLTLCHVLKLLYTDHDMQATNTCDKIYAILGLAADVEALGLQADYTIKDRIDLVFGRTTKAIVAKGGDARGILSMVQHPKPRAELPSWVPDFTTKLDISFAEASIVGVPEPFNASKDGDWSYLPDTDELTLGLTGLTVDEVKDTGDVWARDKSRMEYGNGPGTGPVRLGLHNAALTPDDALQVELTGVPYSHQPYLDYLAQIASLCELSAQMGNPIYSSAQRRSEAVWRTPVGDMEIDYSMGPVRASSISAEAYTRCRHNLEFLRDYRKLSTSNLPQAVNVWEENEATMLPLRYRMRMSWMSSKRPFITTQGYVGMGPQCMREGDLVVVLGLPKMPYVARRVKGESGKYVLLGECYCDGIMDGELVGKRDKETFLFV